MTNSTGTFWKEKTYLPENQGYALFSAKYFLVLALMLLVIAAAVFLFGRQERRRQEKLCRVFAWLPLAMEIVKTVVLAAQGCYTPNYYPIGFCSLVIYFYPLYAYAANGKLRRVARCIICTLLFPAGLATLLFPNWIGQYRFLSYFSLHSYIWHAFMLIYPIWTCQLEREKLRLRDMLAGFAVITALVPIVVFINSRFGTNYWFLSAPTDNHPLAGVYHAAGQGGYFALIILLGYALGFLFGLLQNMLIPRLLPKADAHAAPGD